MPDHVLDQLGYSKEDVNKIWERPETLEGFRDKPPEMVVWKNLKTRVMEFQGGFGVKVKNKQCYITDLVTFIDLYHAGLAKATGKFIK